MRKYDSENPGLKWKNANRNELPADQERVLISANGVYHIAIFNQENKTFEVASPEVRNVFPISSHQIYWTSVGGNGE